MATPLLTRPARLAVFASGRGSNLQSLLGAFPAGHPLASVVLVISNRVDAGALAIAEAAGVKAIHIPFKDREAFEHEAGRRLTVANIDLVCLAGFMRLLSAAFVSAHSGRILNIHPSLLPNFAGLHPQQRALSAGVRESGCSVHFVDAGVDTGPIILQRRVPVLPGDDEESLAARILLEEHKAYPEAVRRVLHGILESRVGA